MQHTEGASCSTECQRKRARRGSGSECAGLAEADSVGDGNRGFPCKSSIRRTGTCDASMEWHGTGHQRLSFMGNEMDRARHSLPLRCRRMPRLPLSASGPN